jgi:hypothetical protein
MNLFIFPRVGTGVPVEKKKEAKNRAFHVQKISFKKICR